MHREPVCKTMDGGVGAQHQRGQRISFAELVNQPEFGLHIVAEVKALGLIRQRSRQSAASISSTTCHVIHHFCLETGSMVKRAVASG
jgi:hypothetical protein